MNVNQIDAKTACQWIDCGDAILIDVREANEYDSMNIKHAHLLPLSELDSLDLPHHANKKIVIHCHSGKRSYTACQYFIQKYPDLDIYNLEGGIVAWAQEGLPVQSAANLRD